MSQIVPLFAPHAQVGAQEAGEAAHARIRKVDAASRQVTLHAMKKTLTQHRKAEAFDNQRLQTWVRDMGISIEQGRAHKMRQSRLSQQLGQFWAMKELIQTHSPFHNQGI